MTPLKTDYHMHTPLCGHAQGQPEAYARQAMAAGLEEIGFSDHAPFVHKVDPTVTMRKEQLPEYHRAIEEIRQRYAGQITILTALEADFLPGYEEQTRRLIEDYPYDYIIGSVHFIGDWGFDNPAERSGWDRADIEQVYRDYYALLRQSARSGLFNIIGHPDLVKKFGHRPEGDLADEVCRTAEVFRETGVAIEINTAGLRKPIGEIYPSLEQLTIYRRAGVPICFGSDAHAPQQVGQDFDQALRLARQAGYTSYVTWRNRRIDKIINLPDIIKV